MRGSGHVARLLDQPWLAFSMRSMNTALHSLQPLLFGHKVRSRAGAVAGISAGFGTVRKRSSPLYTILPPHLSPRNLATLAATVC